MASRRRILKNIKDAKVTLRKSKEQNDTHAIWYWKGQIQHLFGILKSKNKGKRKNTKQFKKSHGYYPKGV